MQDIASVDRMATPWLIIAQHVPYYHSYLDQYKINEVGICFCTGPHACLIYS